MIVCFSGVGNSAWAAQMLANQLDDELCDMRAYIKENRRARLRSDRPWVVVVPTHWWYVPNVVAVFLREGTFSGCTDLYFVMTYAKDVGAPEQKLRRLCQKNGFTYRGMTPVRLADHYLMRRDCPDEETAADLRREAEPILREAGDRVLAGEDFPTRSFDPKGWARSTVGNSWATLLLISSRFFYGNEDCTGCETCVATCPMNNISIVEEHPHWADRCIHCMACVAACPQHAITQHKLPSRKERRQLRKQLREELRALRKAEKDESAAPTP